MIRLLKIVLLSLLLALVPLRGTAALMAGICATVQPEATQTQAASVQNSAHHHDGKPDCSACAEHCTSASLVVAANGMPPLGSAAGRILLGSRTTAGFVPEYLDPPPLAV